DVLVAGADGPRSQRREIGARLWFRELLAPYALALQDAGEVKRALLVGALCDEGRARVHHSHEVDADVRRVGARVLLEVHELLAHRQAAPAEGCRPLQAGVAGVVELALPRGVVRPARGPVAGGWRRTVARHLDLQPRA